MRFSTVVIGVFASLAAAQTTATDSTPSGTGVDPAQTSLAAAIEACVKACPIGDVSCTAKCVAVPNPSESQISATNQCVGQCPKGNGTDADNQKYQDCQLACIGQNYFTASALGPQTAVGAPNGANPTNGANPANPTNGAQGTNGAGGNQASGSGAAPTTTNRPNAAALYTGSSAAGLLAFMAAFLAY